LRGTALDVFGHTPERKMERELIQRYRDTLDALLAKLTVDKRAKAIEIARLPEDIRGFGHVKERHVKAVLPKWEQLLADWKHSP